MESLFKTQIRNQQPKKIKSSCLLCAKLFHVEDTHIYDNEYTVCIDCSTINNTKNIIKMCKENEAIINNNNNITRDIKSVYLIRCKCFLSHQIVVYGLRNIGVQDYIGIYCKCQKHKK